MKMKWGWTFQQDNNPERKAEKTQLASEKENKSVQIIQLKIYGKN